MKNLREAPTYWWEIGIEEPNDNIGEKLCRIILKVVAGRELSDEEFFEVIERLRKGESVQNLFKEKLV